MTDRPILFLDVDGVLNRLGPHPSKEPANQYARMVVPSLDAQGQQVHLHLERADANRVRLLSGQFELVWASTWEDHANTALGPLLGLGRFPVARQEPGDWGSKVPGLLRYAGDRPFAWVDDDTDERDLALLGGFGSQRAVITDPNIGLTGAHVTALLRWAAHITR